MNSRFFSLVAAIAMVFACQSSQRSGSLGPQQSAFEGSLAINFPTVAPNSTAISLAPTQQITGGTLNPLVSTPGLSTAALDQPTILTCGTPTTLPMTLEEVYIGAALTAATFGGADFGGRQITVVSISENISAFSNDGGLPAGTDAGGIGPTGDSILITDGNNTCQCDIPCEGTVGVNVQLCHNISGALGGDGGTGCVFPATPIVDGGEPIPGDTALKVFAVLSCHGTHPTITGNLHVNGCVTK